MLLPCTLALWVASLVSAQVVHYACPRSWTSPGAGEPCVEVFSQSQMTWEAATSECREERGGDLVQIRDSLTNDFVKDLLIRGKRYWIGITDDAENGKFEYVTGDRPLSAFQPWAAGEPNNRGGNERCVEIIGNGRGAWNDKRCSKKRNFICGLDVPGNNVTFGISQPTNDSIEQPVLNSSSDEDRRTRDRDTVEQPEVTENANPEGVSFVLTTDFEKDDLPLHYHYDDHEWTRITDARYPDRGHILTAGWQQPGIQMPMLYSQVVNLTRPHCLTFDLLGSSAMSFVFVTDNKYANLHDTFIEDSDARQWQTVHVDVPPMINGNIQFMVGSQNTPGYIILDRILGTVGECAG